MSCTLFTRESMVKSKRKSFADLFNILLSLGTSIEISGDGFSEYGSTLPVIAIASAPVIYNGDNLSSSEEETDHDDIFSNREFLSSGKLISEPSSSDANRKRQNRQIKADTYLLGDWFGNVGHIDAKIKKVDDQFVIQKYIPHRLFVSRKWEVNYEGYIVEGFSQCEQVEDIHEMQVHKIFHFSAPGTIMQFYSPWNAVLHCGANTLFYNVVDVDSLLSYLYRGETLVSLLDSNLFTSISRNQPNSTISFSTEPSTPRRGCCM